MSILNKISSTITGLFKSNDWALTVMQNEFRKDYDSMVENGIRITPKCAAKFLSLHFKR